MSVQLLDKTRKINKLLHNNNSQKVVFNDICDVLSEILEANSLVISKKGKVLGVGTHNGTSEIKELIADKVGSIEDGKYADLVLMDKSLNIKAVYVHGKEIYSEL